MIIKLENTQGLGVPEFYETVAKQLGYDTTLDNIRYDCRNIDVAKNIQDNFYEFYRNKANENSNEVNTQITMLLAMAGPKVNESLAEDEVDVQDDFVHFSEE